MQPINCTDIFLNYKFLISISLWAV